MDSLAEMPENVDKNNTWQWLSKCDLKIGTEALLCAAQEQAIRTNYVKHYIDKTVKVCNTLLVHVHVCGCENWLRKNIRDDTAM